MPTRTAPPAEPSDVDSLVAQLLLGHSLGALSYIDPSSVPHTTTVEYAVTDRKEIVFTTFVRHSGPRLVLGAAEVSIEVGISRRGRRTATFTGCAAELADGDLATLSAVYCERIPETALFARTFANAGRLAYFRLVPNRVRLVDASAQPVVVEERTVKWG